jgi:cell division protease FtsH
MNSRHPLKRGNGKWSIGKLQWIIVTLVLVGLLCYAWIPTSTPTTVKYGELKQLLQDPTVQFQDVEVTRQEVRGKILTSDRRSNGKRTEADEHATPFRSDRGGLENDSEELCRLLEKAGISYQGQIEESGVKLFFFSLLPPILVICLGLGVFWMLRHFSGGGSPLSFGRSRAKLYAPKEPGVTFADAAGIDEAVEELREVVEFLKTPEKYQALGGRIPKGVLLVGPPGTGKTLLAKAVAGEAHAPFFSLSGSDFVEMFVGVGAARVRDLFAQALSQAPCIIFIDELDALGKTRMGNAVGSHDEREQTLNQLLVEMDGFESNRAVIIMAATNRPETLDPALLRPGRFDRTVVVDRPDINGREAILKVHARHVKLAPRVELRQIAGLTPGFVGADLANLMNEAALLAARNGRSEVGVLDLEEAIERGVAGLEKKKRIMNPEEKQRVAYHEIGHALVACVLPNTDPVHKVSIIPRGVAALGYTLQRPEDDRYLVTRSELVSQIKVLLGGITAEELVYNETSTGAQNDLERASRIARSIVMRFGMSRLGRVNYHDENTSVFLAGESTASAQRSYSEQTAREIDLEVRIVIDEAATEVREILASRREAMEAAAQCLMDKEVIDGAILKDLLHQHYPGPHLVPGTVVVEPVVHGEPAKEALFTEPGWPVERRAENG